MGHTGNRKCVVFAGTSEGRQLYEFCAENRIDAVFCVATDYGKCVLCKLNETKGYVQEGADRQLKESEPERRLCQEAVSKREEGSIEEKNMPQGIEIHVGRMDRDEMTAFLRQESPELVIDATHPYAAEVTKNIRNAAEAYRKEQNIETQIYYRVLRNLTDKGDAPDIVRKQEKEEASVADKVSGAEQTADAEIKDTKISYHEDIRQAVTYLQSTEGNILATTGSKQAGELCKLKGFKKRVYLRILPNAEMLSKCLSLGFLPDHMICMQGPFSEELNEVMMREHDIKYLLTKQSGETGGYPEKVKAARACGAELVVLIPPQETEGVSVEQMCGIIGHEVILR